MDTVKVSPEDRKWFYINESHRQKCLLLPNKYVKYICMYPENVYIFARVILRVISFNSIVDKYA